MDHGTCFRCEFPIRFHPDEDFDATYLRSCLTSVLCTGSDIIPFLMIRQWAAIEEHTEPPYTLTLKSNGCIIFIGALTPSKLLITSKHSLGKCPDPLSHLRSFDALQSLLRSYDSSVFSILLPCSISEIVYLLLI